MGEKCSWYPLIHMLVLAAMKWREISTEIWGRAVSGTSHCMLIHIRSSLSSAPFPSHSRSQGSIERRAGEEREGERERERERHTILTAAELDMERD